uniref:Ankyrin repeat domain-containing protein EMB506, chloroplastic n=1 Tax=Anthurium amnicola TaxID=1678845 RepID=A0A1D1Z603_9ARAE
MASSPPGWPAAAAVPASLSCTPLPLLRLLPPSGAAPASSPSLSRKPPCPLRASRPPPPPWLPLLRTPRGSLFLRAHPSRLVPEGGFWEDPDDGYGSDYEEVKAEEDEEEPELEEEERELFTGTVGGPTKNSASDSERLRHDVELLLNPEEKAILQQNEVPNLSKISSRKWKPFHTRALSGQIPFMDDLLQHGIDIDAPDKDGLTALHKAVTGKKEAVTSHLLRKGADPHVRDRDGATPLHYAVQVGAMQTVKLLIKYKVDVNVADTDGWTPLHLAIQSRSRDIAKVLLVNGADKTRRNKDGKTPLDLSLCYGKDFKSYELAKLIKLVPANREL